MLDGSLASRLALKPTRSWARGLVPNLCQQAPGLMPSGAAVPPPRVRTSLTLGSTHLVAPAPLWVECTWPLTVEGCCPAAALTLVRQPEIWEESPVRKH